MRDPSFGAIAILREQQAALKASLDPHCGFCGKDEGEAGLLIRGVALPIPIYACGPCIHSCADRLPRPESMGRAPK